MVDGDNGMGHLVMQRAADTAIALAKENGVAWVGARRSNHAGAAGTYAAMALPHDMIGIYSAVANANHMPAWGAAESLLEHQSDRVRGAGGRGAAGGARHRHHGRLLRHGEGLQAAGQADAGGLDGRAPRTASRSPIPRKSGEGLLMPIGGHKGSGLALVLGLLAGMLNGAAFGREVVDFNADDESACNTGHFIIALDVSRFLPIAAFKARDRPPAARPEDRRRCCPASTRSACPASSARRAAPTARATACRCFRRWSSSSTSSRAS